MNKSYEKIIKKLLQKLKVYLLEKGYKNFSTGSGLSINGEKIILEYLKRKNIKCDLALLEKFFKWK